MDWYHATGHLWALGKALWGEDTPATRRWVEAAKALLWERGAAALLQEWRTLHLIHCAHHLGFLSPRAPGK